MRVNQITLESAGSFRVECLVGGRLVIHLEEVEMPKIGGVDAIYTFDEARRRLKTSSRNLRAWMHKDVNPVPYSRVGKEARFREAEIQEWLDSRSCIVSRRADDFLSNKGSLK